ncbi:Elongation of very long chain fatty acids protein [Operophtera brumata]|uniref:Elongation of very long chain fatty acids protein n=1 Tax=Operophtera brumata TaxID=104452 RepID=A0A0L7L5V4_OPEBR|nr:Elongation of very long chain fatty acids protein [Operophtera brumata]
MMFVLSKLPELGDTVFIVLRKKPLIFLHWYHHITVLLYTWYSFTEYTSSARWFVVMNYCVHSMGRYPPKALAMVITGLQLTQMVVGCAINLWAFNYMSASAAHSCHISNINIKLSMAMYFSYFVLFAQYMSASVARSCHISNINIKLSMAMYFSYFVLFAQAYLSSKPGKKAKIEPPQSMEPEQKTFVSNGYPRQRNGVVAH